MITVTCQHTGLNFEARSKAARNHPAVAALLTEANKKNAYREAVDAIREAREALGDALTLEDVERFVTAAIDGRRAEMQAERDRWRERREARRERLNALAYGSVPEPEYEDEKTFPESAQFIRG
jgi:hypothetical protein